MQAFSDPSVYQTSKCYVTHGTIGHLDPKQLPIKGKPWATIAGLDFIRKVDCPPLCDVKDGSGY